MLLDAIVDERNDLFNGDDLMKTLQEIADKGTSDATTAAADTSPQIGKMEKNKLNAKEQRGRRFEREAVHARANSVKRALHNVAEHSKLLDSQQKRFSVVENSYVVTSTADTSPWSSTISTPAAATSTTTFPPIKIVSPSVSTTHLTCLSPLPDLRRDSMDDYFFNSLNLPVPKQFADSRRSSGVPYSIREQNELLMDEMFPLCGNKDLRKKSTDAGLATITTTMNTLNINDGSANVALDHHQEKTSSSSNTRLEIRYSSEQRPTTTTTILRTNHQLMGDASNSDEEAAAVAAEAQDEFELMPAEVYERNLLRKQSTAALQMAPVLRKTTNNTLQVPSIEIPILEIERPPPVAQKNVYISENITLIDTDLPVSITFIRL